MSSMADAVFTTTDLRFIDAYIADPMRDPETAYRKAMAGAAEVNPQGGACMLAQDHIRTEIQFRLSRRRSNDGIIAAGITKDKIEDMVLQVAKRCMQRVAIVDRAGRQTGEYKFMPNPAINALKFFSELKGWLSPSMDDKSQVGKITVSIEDFNEILRRANHAVCGDGEMRVVRLQSNQNVIVNEALADTPSVEVADGPQASFVDRTLPGENVADVPAEVTVSGKSIDDFLKKLRQREIID